MIVDSSKNPTIAYLLSKIPQIRLSVIHLVRSPRAVARHWRQPKGHLLRGTAWWAARNWMVLNLATELLGKKSYRFRTVRYEDLVRSPEHVLAGIASELRGRPTTCSFIQQGKVNFSVQHVLGGNPNKQERSTVITELAIPDLAVRDHLLVSMLTYPLSVRYGYAGPLLRMAFALSRYFS